MPVRLTYATEFSISSTTADEKDLGNGNFKVITDDFGEGGTWKTLVSAGASDLQIVLDNVATARFLLLKSNPKLENDPAQSLDVKFNSVGNTPVPLKAPDSKKIAIMLLCTDGLTALYVSNAGSVDVELTVSVAGD
jgi:hypothetical protein